MDADKREVLKKIEYKIRKCCGLCIFASLASNGWGTCSFHKYNHQKHTDEERQLSINRNGYCSEFKVNQEELLKLEKFEEFLEK